MLNYIYTILQNWKKKVFWEKGSSFVQLLQIQKKVDPKFQMIKSPPT